MPLSQPWKAKRVCPGLILAVSLLFWVGCGERDPDKPTIRLGYTPSETSLTDREQIFSALRDYLQKQTGHPVELVKTAYYEPAIHAMRDGEIDVMNFGAQGYLIAESQAGAEAFALRGQSNGAPQIYHSLIIAPRSLPYSSIEEALHHAGQLDVLYTHPASTSGYLVGRTFFLSHGIDPLQSFASYAFSNSHSLSILKIGFEEAHLASVSSRAFAHLASQEKIDPSDYRILWRSEPIPNGPVAYRSGLPDALKQSIGQAYFDLPQKDAETWRLVAQLYPDRPFTYIPCPPDAFEVLRQLRKSDHTSVETAADTAAVAE